mgnify:FL=1
MIEEELKDHVNRIIAMAGDPEAAHSAEDDLHLELIALYCPYDVRQEVLRLTEASFPRWCA